MSLSVVINTKNAANTLENTLESVSFADEIVVVDMMSQDETVEIASSYTPHVFQHEDVGYVEPARNFALEQAKGDWILVVDADEIIPPSLRDAVLSIVSSEEGTVADCYYLPRKNIIFGDWVKTAGWWPDYVLRLFRQGKVSWSDEIHSIPITRGEVKELPAQEDMAIEHQNYQSLEQFVKRMNRYSSIQAQEKYESNEQPLGPSELLKHFNNEFLSRFFARKGVEGGMRGISLSILQACSEALMSMKHWQLEDFSDNRESVRESIKQMSAFQRDLAYWIADWHVERSSGIQNLWWRIRRKIRL